MPAFITETTDEQPQVLLITQQGSFSTAFIAEIHKKNMDVVLADVSIFGDESQSAKLADLNSRYFYKIFWWWGELSEAPSSASSVIEFLLSRKEAISVGAAVLKPFEVHQSGLEHWQRIFELQTRNLAYLQEFLPGSQLILTGSLVGEREDYLTRLIYAQLNSSQPLLPDAVFSAATRSEIAHKITKFLLQPRHDAQGILLDGTQFLMTQAVEAFRILNSQSVQLIPVQPKTTFFSNFNAVTVETPAGKRELLDEIKHWRIQPVTAPVVETTPEVVAQPVPEVLLDQTVIPNAQAAEPVLQQPASELPPASAPAKSPFSQLKLGRKEKKTSVIIPIAPPMPPTWYPELDAQLEEMVKRQKPRVVSTFPPLIENRLKRYETTKKKKVEHQKHLTHIPKTASKMGVSENTTFRAYQEKSPQDLQSVKEIDSQLVKIFGAQRQVIKATTQSTTVQQVQKVVVKNRRLSKVTLVLGLLMSVGIFAGLVAGGFFANKFLVESSLDSLISSSNYSSSEKKSRADLLMAYSNAFAVQTDVWQSILGKERLKYSATLGEVGKEAATSVSLDSEMTQLGRDLWQQIVGATEGSPLTTVVSLTGKTEEAYKKLSLIQAKIQNMEEDGSTETNKQLIAFNDKIQDRRKVLAVSQQFQQTLPFLLAQGGRRTYVVVLQNNLELRPTGGVLQAAVLVTFQNGTLVNTQSLNVAQLDQNFSGSIVPPSDLEAVMGQKKWLLRDANWSAHFPSAAKHISSFVEKSSGQKIDGVIGLNLYSLQNLIRATGPISLPQYQETVTDKNVLEKVAFHSELAVVPTAAPDYLTVLLNEEVKQLMELPPEKTQALGEALFSSLKEDQLFVWINDPGVASTLDSVGWSGAVLTPNCPTQFVESTDGCIVDSIFQVESNVGINRANFFIQRSIDQQIQVSQTKISHQRMIVYNNTATSNSWPAGAYRNYLRFYVPSNVTNVSAEINNQLVPATDLIETAEGDKKIVGFLVNVPIQQQVTVKFSYDTDVEHALPFAYTFFDQKQSGTSADTEQIRITLQDGLKPVYIAPQASVNGEEVTFSTTQDKHLFVGIKLR